MDADLSDLERRLAERPGPPPALRPRLLAAVARERRRGWRFLVTTAAAAVLGVNLSMSLGINTGWQNDDSSPGLEATAQQVRLLYPGLGEDEVRREAMLVRAGGQLSPGPDVGLVPGEAIFQQEGESWGMR